MRDHDLQYLIAEANAMLAAGGYDSWAEDADLIKRLRDAVAELSGLQASPSPVPQSEPTPPEPAAENRGLWWLDNGADPIAGVQLRGVLLENVHPESTCAGRPCCLHNPSDHPLKNAQLNWRGDRRIMERICEHGIGHDDPDDLAYRQSVDPNTTGTHGCDGCCRAATEQERADG